MALGRTEKASLTLAVCSRVERGRSDPPTMRVTRSIDPPGSPPKKKAKFVHDGSSESEIATSKSKRKGSNKVPKRLKDEALPHLPLKDGFRSAKDMMVAFANEGMSSSEPESLSQIRCSTKRRPDELFGPTRHRRGCFHYTFHDQNRCEISLCSSKFDVKANHK
jgi:hypothetical protein